VLPATPKEVEVGAQSRFVEHALGVAADGGHFTDCEAVVLVQGPGPWVTGQGPAVGHRLTVVLAVGLLLVATSTDPLFTRVQSQPHR
jgi:hypothetical protein